MRRSLRGERLEVVVAEEEVDPPPPHRLPQEPGQSGLLVEEEGHGGLRPHDEPGARVGGLLGELQVPPDVRRGVLGHPLVLLPDASLHEPDRDAPRLRDRLLHLPAAPAPGPAHQERHRGERRAPRRRARRHRRVRQQGRDRADEERDPVDRRDRGDLGEGQEIVLAVAEERPGEREEGVGAGVLEPGPQHRGAEESGRSERRREARRPPPEQGMEDGEREAERHHDEEADRQRQAAVLDDHEGRPVQQADGGDRSRHVAQPRRAPARRARQGHQQRRERHPGDRPVPELREGEEEEQARERGQGLPAPAAQLAPPPR